MPLFKFCASIALLLTIVAGCSNSDAPTNGDGAPPDQSTVDASTDSDDSQQTNESFDSGAPSETPESRNTAATESNTLKQAMIDVTADLMKKQQPDTGPDAIRGQVENGIAQIRKEVPNFLMVSADTEEKLKAGTQIESSNKRISDAEAFLNEYGIQRSGLVAALLQQHKTGTLSPVRTELLAQLIVADKQKAEDALSN